MHVLGIETSCDETSAAVVSEGRLVRSNVVFSQVELHGPYGGVVPEIASRSHVETLPGVIDEAVRESGVAWADIDAVAVTYGPGLASSLLVGVSAAKALALRLDVPLVAVNHLQAHIYSVFLGAEAPQPSEVCPFLALVVSGGHTCLVRVDALGRYRLLGQTIDDAAGEAFDKGANLLGLGYPGGPVIDRTAKAGRADAVAFPRGRQKADSNPLPHFDAELCFSFSGLKTALLYYLREHPAGDDPAAGADVAASYQEAIVDALVDRCDRALGGESILACVGGVSLNSRLRDRLQDMAEGRGIRLLLAASRHCADNAAMIAGLAGAGEGLRGEGVMELDADPNLPLTE